LSIHLFVVGRSMVGWINFGVMQSILGHIGWMYYSYLNC
jgi:hypothetical protein